MKALKILMIAVTLIVLPVFSFADEDQEVSKPNLSWIGNCEITNYSEIFYALELDPIGYFNPGNVNTDLEIKLFKKTSEYKKMLSNLKEIRNKIATTTYCINTTFDINEYNTARRSIEIKTGDNPIITIKALYNEAMPAKVSSGFYFPSLKTYEK